MWGWFVCWGGRGYSFCEDYQSESKEKIKLHTWGYSFAQEFDHGDAVLGFS